MLALVAVVTPVFVDVTLLVEFEFAAASASAAAAALKLAAIVLGLSFISLKSDQFNQPQTDKQTNCHLQDNQTVALQYDDGMMMNSYSGGVHKG